MITNASQKVEFGERSIVPFSFQTQSEENTTVDPIIESEGKISRKSEIIKDDENSNDYSNFELTFKTDNVGKKNMRDDIDQKRERMKNKMKKKCNYCDSYVINSSVHENVHKGIKYKCTECVHESHDKSNLVKHMKTRHFKEPSKCSKCNKELKDIAARYDHQCQRSYILLQCF